MSHPEDQPGRFRPDSEPIVPIALPPDLADFLGRAGDFAFVPSATDRVSELAGTMAWHKATPTAVR